MEINYRLKRSKRARRYTLALKGNEFVLTAPYHAPRWHIERFAKSAEKWAARILKKSSAFKSLPEGTGTRQHFLTHKDEARRVIESELERVNSSACFTVASISIRNQQSRWGSCSRGGKLSFNYRLLFLPPRLREYVIVHELCHIKEMNHSKRFWGLVEDHFPDWQACRKELSKYRLF